MRLISIGEADLEVDVRGSGEPVVLIQTALTADQFLPLADQPSLRDAYRVILFHRRGYGNSSRVDGPGSISLDAKDCRDLLDALDIDRAHVVVVSYSAAVALQMAVSAPSLVHTLTVIEPPPVHIPNVGEFFAANIELMQLHQREGTSHALDNFLTRLMGPSWRRELEQLLPGSVDQVERDAATFFTADMPALLSWDFDGNDASGIRQPTLHIGGTKSGPWFTEERSVVLDWLPEPEDVAIRGADHNVVVTHPEETARALTDFISRYPMYE